jgi:hypothetical protein
MSAKTKADRAPSSRDRELEVLADMAQEAVIDALVRHIRDIDSSMGWGRAKPRLAILRASTDDDYAFVWTPREDDAEISEGDHIFAVCEWDDLEVSG